MKKTSQTSRDKKCIYGHRHYNTTKNYCDATVLRDKHAEKCGQLLKDVSE